MTRTAIPILFLALLLGCDADLAAPPTQIVVENLTADAWGVTVIVSPEELYCWVLSSADVLTLPFEPGLYGIVVEGRWTATLWIELPAGRTVTILISDYYPVIVP